MFRGGVNTDMIETSIYHDDVTMKLNDIIATLRKVYDKYDNIKLGIAGSYANGTQHNGSDIDIVIDGDSTRVDIMDYIKDLFSIPVDVLWVDLMKQEDEELDKFAIQNGFSTNPYSVYKTVMKEVKWICVS